MSFNTISFNAQLRSTLVVAAACTAIIGGLGLAVPAHAAATAKQMTVDYKDLNLSLDKDVQRLYSRLRQAARSVCAPINGRTQFERELYGKCFDESLANAVNEVNATQLSKLHAKAEGLRSTPRPQAS